MCDECEAIWLEPTTSAPHHFPDAEDPLCPLTGVPLYGSSSRWATTDDLRGSAWENEVIVDLPMDISTASDADSLVTGDDIAGGLDVPPIDPTDDNLAQEALPEDLAYGKDEPRPGC